jgi:hypothetical protein
MPVRLPVGCLVGEAVRRGELRRGEDIDLILLMDWISIVALSFFNNVRDAREKMKIAGIFRPSINYLLSCGLVSSRFQPGPERTPWLFCLFVVPGPKLI